MNRKRKLLLNNDILQDVLRNLDRPKLEYVSITNRLFRDIITTRLAEKPYRSISCLRIGYNGGPSYPRDDNGLPESVFTLTHYHEEVQFWKRQHSFEELLPYLRAKSTICRNACISFEPSYFLPPQLQDCPRDSQDQCDGLPDDEWYQNRIRRVFDEISHLAHLWRESRLIVEFQRFGSSKVDYRFPKEFQLWLIDTHIADVLFQKLFHESSITDSEETRASPMKCKDLELRLYYNTVKLSFDLKAFPLLYNCSSIKFTLGDVDVDMIIDFLHSVPDERQNKQDVCLNLEYSCQSSMTGRWEGFQFELFINQLKSNFLSAAKPCAYKFRCEFFGKLELELFLLQNPMTEEILKMEMLDGMQSAVTSYYAIERSRM
ncbi:hypothetical protein DdX_11103 [Ditylenchus destructor]|uniref:Uncharacterized protein n=1 Tax=Ditylenchus destructor TaxID=166010 RepID=A0AAD4R4N4_9BILA|nr:hypothetical protein DdX_11103 [Ditylenchus destructor]